MLVGAEQTPSTFRYCLVPGVTDQTPSTFRYYLSSLTSVNSASTTSSCFAPPSAPPAAC